ncbi:MAG TPA: Shedu immune nuclease family protein [Flavisolibacter sp.]|nr:Shedu immune nuclease family protein [Flavisolibacter sp.]
MISFEDQDNDLVLVYVSEMQPISWVDRRLDSEGSVTFNRTITVTKADLIKPENSDDEVRRFLIGSIDEGYRKIHKEVLGIKHDLLISKAITLHKEVFVAQKNISIFRHVDNLVSEQVTIGGDGENVIPEEEFRRLIKGFPTSTELVKYTDARIAGMLREYLETMTDAEERLLSYMKRRQNLEPVLEDKKDLPLRAANELELEKYIFVRDKLKKMLETPLAFHETYWQKTVANLFLLIFPQYIAVLEDVSVKEYYSKPSKATLRKFDLVLVNANGCIDILEIKKPFDNSLVSNGTYRDNHIPRRELSGSIMQAEKYLFYLSKGGRDIEQETTIKYKSQLPTGLEIKVTNPKAIILNGRDNNLSREQKIDLEFIRRKYSNIVDILSYDDLLRRLDNIIEILHIRSGA